MRPSSDRPETWYEMLRHETEQTERVYLSMCASVGLAPRKDTLDFILEENEREMLDATVKALGMARYDMEVEIAAKRIHWRREPPLCWCVQVRRSGGNWIPVILPDVARGTLRAA